MPLVDMKDMLEHAHRHRYAIGAFDLVSLDFLDAIVAATEARRAPVILSLAESHFEYYDFELAMAATVTAARRATVPVAIHLDHGASFGSAVRAINLGCNGVMVDASHLPLAGNIDTTRAVTDMAHACGVPVEGELGYVAGVEGEDAEKHPARSCIPQWRKRVPTSSVPASTFLRFPSARCTAACAAHPGSTSSGWRISTPASASLSWSTAAPAWRRAIPRLVAHGVAKINYYTALADAAGDCIRANAARDTRAGYSGLMRGVRATIQAEVERVIGLFGGAGQAPAVLAACRRVAPVAHVILYNVQAPMLLPWCA